MTRTLYDKLWDAHWVGDRADGSSLLYIDRQLLHEVTSPQAFAGLREAGRQPWRSGANLATVDHNVPTENREAGLAGITDETSLIQVQTLDDNCAAYDILEFGIADQRQGIVHVIGPEQGLTLPGMTLVCGDSHTSTHGALAALAQGIGTSEVEHVLATQCLVQNKLRNMRAWFDGEPPPGVSAKDLILALIGQIGTAGGTGCALEFAGDAVRGLSMEGRMTLCNMAIEAGARAGLIACDQKTVEYVTGRPFTPTGELLERALLAWKDLVSDEGEAFDTEIRLDTSVLAPQVTWGTTPAMVCGVDRRIPDCEAGSTEALALQYMDLKPGTAMTDIALDRVFIGSCTNSRIEDLRAAAAVVEGRTVASSVNAMVVPGSGLVKAEAEAEGLAQIFVNAGFQWRAPGCSMCLGMNPDTLAPQERCASTSNRNFEGRQGYQGRTHLVSPQMAAAAAIYGHFVDLRDW